MTKSHSAATIIRVAKNADNPFVMVDKRVLEDPRLSWKAKGLMGYMLSRPDNWRISLEDLIQRATEGRDAVRTGLEELEYAGYVVRRRTHNPDGTFGPFELTVYERPVPPAQRTTPAARRQRRATAPLAENPTMAAPPPLSENPPMVIAPPLLEKPFTENPTHINTNNTNTKKKKEGELEFSAAIEAALSAQRQLFPAPAALIAPLLAATVQAAELTPPVAAALLLFDAVQEQADGELPLAVWRLGQMARSPATRAGWLTPELLATVRQRLHAAPDVSPALPPAGDPVDAALATWWLQICAGLPAETRWRNWLQCTSDLRLAARTLLVRVPHRGAADQLAADLRPRLSPHLAEQAQLDQIAFVAWDGSGYAAPVQAPALANSSVEAAAAWQQVLRLLELEITRATFDAYLRDSRAVEYTASGILVLAVKSPYVAAFLEQRLLRHIRRTWARVTDSAAAELLTVQFIPPAGLADADAPAATA